MTDIFLSYTERDRDAARRIAGVLSTTGWTVWWDRRIPAGETWRSVLEDALENMRCMVVLWSARSIESEWVYEEASEGRRQGKLVPVMIENVRPPAGFREIQAADLTAWDGSPDFDGLRMLLADLENLLGKPEGNVVTTAAAATAPTNPAEHLDTANVRGHPYDTTDLPGRVAPSGPGTRSWRMLWALAGALLLAGAVAYIGQSSRQQAAPPTESAAESAATRPDRSLPPSDPAPPTAILQPDASRHPIAAEDSPTALSSHPRTLPALTPAPTTPAPTTVVRRSDSTRLSSATCANWLARIQLGETLSETSQARFNKECRQ